jgi:hypothetical protein
LCAALAAVQSPPAIDTRLFDAVAAAFASMKRTTAAKPTESHDERAHNSAEKGLRKALRANAAAADQFAAHLCSVASDELVPATRKCELCPCAGIVAGETMAAN